MDITTYVLGGIAVILLIFAVRQGREIALQGLQVALGTFWRDFPLLVIGFVIAGLAHVLIPKDIIANWLGNQAGVRGVLVGCVAGGIMPGSPYAVFPIVASLYKSGASLGAMVGFISAWALWSLSRLPVEIALIGPKEALLRYAITFFMPPIAGLIAFVLGRFV